MNYDKMPAGRAMVTLRMETELGPFGMPHHTIADTAPLAICRAALKV